MVLRNMTAQEYYVRFQDSNINGEIDIGSGSSFQTTNVYRPWHLNENGLYGLKATLRISTVVMDTNSSEVFNLARSIPSIRSHR